MKKSQGPLLKDLTAKLELCISSLCARDALVDNLLRKDEHYSKVIKRDLTDVPQDSLVHDLITLFQRLDALLEVCSLNKLLVGLSNPHLKLTTDHTQDLLNFEVKVQQFLRNPYQDLSNLNHQVLLEIIAKSERAVKSCLGALHSYTFFPDSICKGLLDYFGKTEPTENILYSMCGSFSKDQKLYYKKGIPEHEKEFYEFCSAFLFEHQSLEKFYTDLTKYHLKHKPPQKLPSLSSAKKPPKISQYHRLSEFVLHFEQCYCSHLAKLHVLDQSNFSFFAFKCSLESDSNNTTEFADMITKLYDDVPKARRLSAPTELNTTSDGKLLIAFYDLKLKIIQAQTKLTSEQSVLDTSSKVDL